MLNGYGRSQYANGDVYEGYFKNGTMNGLGLYYRHIDHKWIFGYFVDSIVSNELRRFNENDFQNLTFSN